MDVLTLMQSKNRCLQRLLDISTTFLVASEKGDFSGLDDFELQRNAIIQALDLYDRKIAEVVAKLSAADRTPPLLSKIEETLAEKNRLIQSILTLDDRIIQAIEREKSRIQTELANSRKSQALMNKFKSSWVAESGEELDSTL